MDDQAGWCTIESDPGVFTELVEQLGVQGVEFQEVFSLDTDSLSALGEVYGLIFLFKYRDNTAPRETLAYIPDGLFFAKQVVNNACATQAILSVLLNTTPDQVDIGSTLSDFKQFTEGLDDESRGYSIGNCEPMRIAHNSFKPHISLEISHEDDKRKGEAFHFVSYVWVNGRVYELDGLQSGPVLVGQCLDRNDWLSVASPHIQSRIGEYTASGDDEIRFNLMGIVKDRRAEFRAQIESASDATVKQELEARLEEAESRRARWSHENVRRRHDFMPLALTCLQALAEEGKLVSSFEQARVRTKAADAAAAVNK